MKLLLTEHEYHRDCIRVTWGPEDKEVSWISLFLTDMLESRSSARADDIQVAIGLFNEFSQRLHSCGKYVVRYTPVKKWEAGDSYL